MALTEVQGDVRYVVGPGPTCYSGNPCAFLVRGDVVKLAPGYPTLPDSEGDVKVDRVTDGTRSYINIKHLTPEAEATAPAADQLVPVASISDLAVDDVLQVKDSIPSSAGIPAGTRFRVTRVTAGYATVAEVGNAGVITREVPYRQLRYVDKVVPATPDTDTDPADVTEEHAADLKKIADALLTEATSRGGRWPGVYDALVARLNPQLTVKLPERERPFQIDLGADLGFVTVTARSIDEAKAKLLDRVDTLS